MAVMEGGGAARLGVLFGSDNQHGKVLPNEGWHGVGTTDIRLLQSGDQSDFVRLNIPVNFLRLKAKPSLTGVGVVLNLITDADRNPIVLGLARRFLKGFSGRVINRPEDVLDSGRDRVAERMKGIDGLVVPAVARFKGRPNLALAAIDRAGLRFPAILRVAGRHDGHIVGVCADSAAVLEQLDPGETYYLTQFYDLRDPSGLYRKYRIFYFGERGVIRHRLVSDHWNVHGPDRERFMPHYPDEIAAEKHVVEGGPGALPAEARRILGEMRARMPLDFFGIDFDILPDGRVILFEANATMMFFPISTDPRFAFGHSARAQATAAFDTMLAG
jgi:hypothetical protein